MMIMIFSCLFFAVELLLALYQWHTIFKSRRAERTREDYMLAISLTVGTAILLTVIAI